MGSIGSRFLTEQEGRRVITATAPHTAAYRIHNRGPGEIHMNVYAPGESMESPVDLQVGDSIDVTVGAIDTMLGSTNPYHASLIEFERMSD